MSKIEEFLNNDYFPGMSYLSPEAKATFKQYGAIMQDESISFKDRCEKAKSVYNRASDAVKVEMKWFRPIVC